MAVKSSGAGVDNQNLCGIVDAFAGLRVLVVGEAILDGYLAGPTHRLCREAPVPVVDVDDESYVPGGAGNAAANVESLGARVDFLSVMGQDAEADLLRRALQERGVSDEHLIAQADRRTVAKFRVLAEAQMLVRFDRGTTRPVDAAAERWLVRRLEDLFPRADAVLVSDYGLGLFTPTVIRALEGLQGRLPRVLAVDSRNQLTAFRTLGPTFVKPNFREVLELISPGIAWNGTARADRIVPYGRRVLEATGAQLAAVTLDTEGAVIFERDNSPYRTYAEPRPQSRAAGAGDTFAAAMVLALAAGARTPGAAEIASAAAAQVVAKDGTALCFAEELRDRVSGTGKVLADVPRLAARADRYRRQGKRIVFTNGCFDILHRGHVTYLSQAKALGDVLVVAVNSDRSVARLKGPGRPVNALEDRLQVLAALSCVDHVISFDADTPSELIEAVRPHVFVKGGDYTRPQIPEAPLVESLGGTVEVLPYLDDRSTTRIIQRVKTGEVAYAESAG